MSLTKNEIRDRVATDYLGLIQLGETLEHKDSVRILQGIDEVYEYLKTKGLATWASTGSVPNDLIPFFTALVANNCYSAYGLSTERQNKIILDSSTAEASIRELVSNSGTLEEEPTSF